MAKKDDGGAAFPIVEQFRAFQGAVGDRITAEPGMTLRDYFAAQALTGAIRHCTYLKSFETNRLPWSPAVAELVYQIADAMIAERNK